VIPGRHDAEPPGQASQPPLANGTPAFGQYRPVGKPWALHVVQTCAGLITAIHSFVDTQRLFPLFGLPLRPTRRASLSRRPTGVRSVRVCARPEIMLAGMRDEAELWVARAKTLASSSVRSAASAPVAD
jgi:hypothetical protein